MATRQSVLGIASAIAVASQLGLAACSSGSTSMSDMASMADMAAPPPPTISYLTPSHAPNNTTDHVFVTGTGFRPGVTVTIGTSPCKDLTLVSPTEIKCFPQGSFGDCGLKTVTVQNTDKQSASANLFTFGPSMPFSRVDDVLAAGPLAIVAADFDSDGKLDLAVASSGSQSVNFYFNDGANGPGTFTKRTSIPVGRNPNGLAAGDMNKDGKMDLLVTDSVTSEVDLLLGDGAGGFPTVVNTLRSAGGGGNVVIGDLNRDSNPDAIVSSPDFGLITVFLGNGKGALAAQPSMMVSKWLGGVALADLNKDGILDFVTVGANVNSPGFSVRPGNGDGTFGAGFDMPLSSNLNGGFVLQDINGDQNPDLLITANGLHVYLGDGKLGFKEVPGSPFFITYDLGQLAVSDVNADGKLDAITAGGNGSNAVSILLGDGKGSFTEFASSPITVGYGGYYLAAADFNKDGIADLATPNFRDNTVEIRYGVNMCN